MFNLPDSIKILIWEFDDTLKKNYNKVVSQLDKYSGYKKSYNKVMYRITRFPKYVKSENDIYRFETIYNLPNLELIDSFSVRHFCYKKAFLIGIKGIGPKNIFI